MRLWTGTAWDRAQHPKAHKATLEEGQEGAVRKGQVEGRQGRCVKGYKYRDCLKLRKVAVCMPLKLLPSPLSQ